jgi:hypothetical protein
MSGKPRTEQEKLERTLAEVREAIQEMHGVLRDVRQVKRDVSDMIKKSRLDWEKESMEFVNKELEELGQDLRKHVLAQREEITKSFDRLYEELNGAPDWAEGKTVARLLRESINKVEREARALMKAEKQ